MCVTVTLLAFRAESYVHVSLLRYLIRLSQRYLYFGIGGQFCAAHASWCLFVFVFLALKPIVVVFSQPSSGLYPPRFLGFLITHKTTRATVGRTPLDEWSIRRRDLYLTTQLSQQTNIHAPGGIRTHNLSRRAPKTYALDRAATGTGYEIRYSYKIIILKHDEYLVHYIAENNNFPKKHEDWNVTKSKKSCRYINVHLTLHLKVLQTVIVFWEGSILSHCFVAFGLEDSFLCWKMAETPDSYNLVVEKCNKTIRVSFSMILFVFENCSAVAHRFRCRYAALEIQLWLKYHKPNLRCQCQMGCQSSCV